MVDIPRSLFKVHQGIRFTFEPVQCVFQNASSKDAPSNIGVQRLDGKNLIFMKSDIVIPIAFYINEHIISVCFTLNKQAVVF
jgi:hypothetical protein